MRHNDGLDLMRLVVIVDLPHGEDAGIGFRRIALTFGFAVPIENTSNERRDKEGSGIGASGGLGQREHERHIAVDTLALKYLRGPDSFPRGGDFDQDALVVQTQLFRIR